MAAINVKATGVVYDTGELGLYVRSRASLNGSIIDGVFDGTKFQISKIDGNWCYSPDLKGWLFTKYVKITYDEEYKSEVISQISKDENDQKAKQQEELIRKEIIKQQMDVIAKEVNYKDMDDTSIVDSLIVNNLNGVYGIPYQFMESVDPRLESSKGKKTDIGKKYAEKIIAKMPLLCITPGTIKFMSNFSKDEKNGLLNALNDIAHGRELETDVDDIIKNNGRYFTFEFAYKDYFEYVNGLCRTGARFLNIHNLELQIGSEKAKASRFDWALALNKNLKATLTSQEFIAFYMDSADSVTETFSNDTTQSQLSSSVNQVSDLAREVGFLLGAGAGATIQVMDQAKLDQTMASIDEISKKYLNGSNFLTNLGKNFATVAVGGKLLFPEIWSDSSFSRNFNVSIKLRTPDCDTLSWYLNIYVPLCHLIALAAGHQTEHVNGYLNPFLIRAYYKGLFNVDMGIVTGLSITKGKESSWNVDGLPTEIDVDLEIKDLYNMLSIAPGNEPKNFVNNHILMDYIANTCGININQMDIVRSLEIYYILKSNDILDIPNKISRSFHDALDTLGANVHDKIMSMLPFN